MDDTTDPYKYVGTFSALAGKSILARLEKETVRFQVSFDGTPAGFIHGIQIRSRQRAINEAVNVYVHERDLSKVDAIMIALGHRMGVDFVGHSGRDAL